MLQATFVHAQGIGFTTERGLWRKGIRNWGDFRSRAESLTLSRRTRDALLETVGESESALKTRSASYFARVLPNREHWRAATAFDRLGFLDIETDGGMDASSVTVIGLSDGYDCRIYIKGRDLNEFATDCLQFDGFVTFFGAGFDIPMLRRRFPSLDPVFRERLHIDLCPALRRIGYSGGLKRIESQIGVRRVPETEGLDGMDAVRLWSIYDRGGVDAQDALRLLLAYNREDVVNMKTLLDFALPKLRQATGIDEEP